MSLKQAPVVHADMRIRKPAAEVYRAFADPSVTTHFWFSRASAPLERVGQTLDWYWDMYGVSAAVEVLALEPHRRIVIAWPSRVEWEFQDRGDGTTFVRVTASDFSGDDDVQVAEALDSMGGFSLVLAACKAWLEHGIELNVVADHAPDARVDTKI